MKSPAYLLIAFLPLFMSGCTMMKVSVSQNRRIGVVALVPNKLQTKYVGVWAFSNKSGDADVPEARFPETVSTTTAEGLRRSGFTVVPVSYDPSALWAKYAKRHNTFGSYLTDNRLGDTERRAVGDELRGILAAYRLDALAVVVPDRPNQGGEAAIGVGEYGFGIWAFDKEKVSTYAMTKVLILQGPALRTITLRSIGNLRPMEGVGFKERFRDYAPEQQAQLLQAMRDGFATSAGEVIPKMASP